jgi:hypothetical protein
VTPAKARKLLGLGQPARFGRGKETVTDPQVRDTWEIPKHFVRAKWNNAALKDVLATVKEGLGLPNAAELTADPHSLLVYEPDAVLRRYDIDDQFNLGIELMMRSLDCKNGAPGC